MEATSATPIIALRTQVIVESCSDAFTRFNHSTCGDAVGSVIEFAVNLASTSPSHHDRATQCQQSPGGRSASTMRGIERVELIFCPLDRRNAFHQPRAG